MKQSLSTTFIAVVVFGVVACGGSRDSEFDTTIAGGEVAPGTDTTAMATNPAADLPATDASIIDFVTTVDNAEVEAGELARTKATNADVKSFARMMVNDHGKDRDAMAKLKTDTTMMSTPSGAQTMLQSEHSQEMSRLQSLSGAEFDRAYIESMVNGHQKVLDFVTQLQSRAQSPELQQHLTQVADAVQKHLDRARSIQGKLSASPSDTTP